MYNIRVWYRLGYRDRSRPQLGDRLHSISVAPLNRNHEGHALIARLTTEADAHAVIAPGLYGFNFENGVAGCGYHIGQQGNLLRRHLHARSADSVCHLRGSNGRRGSVHRHRRREYEDRYESEFRHDAIEQAD
jgi:hypothetical protein